MLFSIDTIHDDDNYRIKDREKALVFHKLCVSHNNTRKMIAENLNLRPITVSKIIKELIEDGLVFEGDSKERSSKGRPEIQLAPNYCLFSAISIYVISREIKGVLVNLNGEILESESILIAADADNTAIITEVEKILKILVSKLPGKSQLIGIGTSLPGTVNGETGKWISSSRWPNLKNISFTDLASGFNIPLSLNRSLDPELEYLLFNNERYRRGGTLLFHWGYGIGSAFALEGKILKSNLGRFGEVGHWQVKRDSSKECRCGSIGCLETEAALWAILPKIRNVYPDAPEDEPEFTDFIRNNDIGNLEVIKKALGYVTMSLANLYKVFYPDRILLLGPFVNDSTIYQVLEKEFLKKIPEYARSSVELDVIAGSEGAALGSVYHLFRDALRPFLRTRTNV